jgi:RNA polymerase sigma-70 factor (ECF subfamily)
MHRTPSKSERTRATLLIRLTASGRQREVAWGEFNELYAPIISGFARRMGAGQQDIDDIVQEVLKSFFAITPRFQYDPQKGPFRGYLKTCVWNELSELRRRQSRERKMLGAGRSTELNELAVDEVWNDVWETEKLGRALTLARQRYADSAERRRTFRAFEMSALEERSAGEIAAELGMSLESVRAAKSRVSRAVRKAFDKLDEMAG